MPIVITPSGEYVDSVTGNPVQMTTPPMDNMAQRLSQGIGQTKKQCQIARNGCNASKYWSNTYREELNARRCNG
jgi:hypothetical protein